MSVDARRLVALDEMGLAPVWVRRGVVTADEARGKTGHSDAGTPRSGATPVGVASMGWEELRDAVAPCRACGLCETRQQTVFGVGNQNAEWMLVGEAPGAEEDARGEPFVGQAGRLLDNMLAAIGLTRRHDVFIANVLKCRPPNNRNPEPAEVQACEPYLLRQIELVRPRVIIVLGRFAAQSLLGTEATIANLRGKIHRARFGDAEIPVVVTYHPAYLLRTLTEKSKAWADLSLARRVWRDSPERQP